MLYQYGIILLAYSKLGNIDDNTLSDLKKYFSNSNIDLCYFNRKCELFYNNICKVINNNKDFVNNNPNSVGYLLSEKIIVGGLKHLLGTIFAIYVREYCNFNDIVYLNNNINNMNDKDILEICSSIIGIKVYSEDFYNNLNNALKKYIDYICNIKSNNLLK